MLELLVKYFEDLLEEMNEDDMYWQIEEIVEGHEIEEDEDYYLQLKNGGKYKKQDDIYIKQWTGHSEDDYHGFIFRHLHQNKYLKIRYQC